MEHLIELRDVYKIYQMGDEAVHALDGVSLTVDPGSSWPSWASRAPASPPP